MRGAPLVFGLFLVAACSDVLVVPDDGASSSTAGSGVSAGTGTNTGAGDSVGGGGSGGGPVGPQQIEIAVRNESDENLLVLLNEPDGTLVDSWRGNELPVITTVVDGQTVSFAHVGTDDVVHIASRRVTPEVARIEGVGWQPWVTPCAERTMQFAVDVPAIGTSDMAHARLNTGAYSHVLTLPGTINLSAASCFGAVSKVDVLVAVGETTFDAFELIQDVPFEPGATVEITPTFATEPRSVMHIDVDDLGDATSSSATIQWKTDAEHTLSHGGMIAFEQDLELFVLGNAPYTYAPNAVDLPHGYQEARIRVTFPPTAAACDRSAHLRRRGRSEQPIAFHASALAEPLVDGDSWTLAEGEVGQTIERRANDEATHWTLLDDAVRASTPMVFPQFPNELPEGFELPAVPPSLSGILHIRSTGVASYSEKVASVNEPVSATVEWRGSNMACP